jgi:hypothetical protein
MSKVTNSNTTSGNHDDRVRMVSSFSKQSLAFARECPLSMALTIAVNGLRTMWFRHAGGPWRPEDKAILEVSALLCMRLLSAKGAPRMQGGIGSLAGADEANFAVRS